MKFSRLLINLVLSGLCLFLLANGADAKDLNLSSNTAPLVRTDQFKLTGLSVRSQPLRSPYVFLDMQVEINPPIAEKLTTTAKQPPLNVIEGEITDPNFNVMRKQATKKSTAISWVVGCIIIAVAVPLGTWWYLGK